MLLCTRKVENNASNCPQPFKSPVVSPLLDLIHMSSIAAWAAAVLPGSPAPLSPCSFLLPTPPSPKPVDLTNLGYTTVFIRIPNTLSRIIPSSPKQQLRSTPSILRRLRSLTKRTPSKKAKYDRVPSPSLMQFAAGGNIDSHTDPVMKPQGAASQTGVYKDENGHLWWDEDKKIECTHLLEGGEGVDMYNYDGNEGMDEWVGFSSLSQQRCAPLAMDTPAGRSASELDRREILSTPGSSQLGARNIVKPAEDAAHPVVPGLSLLSVPSRARKATGDAVKHLRKPEFLVDVDPFGRGPRTSTGEAFVDSTSASRPKGKARKRPAPLKIPSSASSSMKPSNSPPSSASWPSAESLRREFLGNSSEPMSHATTSLAGIAGSCQGHLRAAEDCTKKPSRLNLRAMFGLGMSTS
jgi:hypothetical protein